MSVLSYAQLKGLWLNVAKGTKYDNNTWASLMAAIAEAESGGNTQALNPNDNGGTQSSFGLWQISTGTHTPPASNWADPAENARLAIGKLNGQGLSAWGTYDSGAYRAYLSDGTAPDDTYAGDPGAVAAQTAATETAAVKADCLIGYGGIPGTSIFNDIFGSGGNVGQFCLFTRSEARGLIGVMLMVTGGLITIPGLMLILAGVPKAATAVNVINRIPVAGPAASSTAAAAQGQAAKLPWYQAANNPGSINPLAGAAAELPPVPIE